MFLHNILAFLPFLGSGDQNLVIGDRPGGEVATFLAESWHGPNHQITFLENRRAAQARFSVFLESLENCSDQLSAFLEIPGIRMNQVYVHGWGECHSLLCA